MDAATASVAVLVPMLGRPHRVEPLLDSLAAATDATTYRVLFLLTPGDSDVIVAVERTGGDWIAVDRHEHGDYARKINAGYLATTEPLLFLGADDLHFHPHWFERAAARLDDPRVGVVGTNDLGNARVMRGDHATHSVVRRSYIDEQGTIDEPRKVLYEGYVHEFVDDELVGTARKREAWAFAEDSIVEHLHPQWGKAPVDSMYEAQQDRMRASRRLFDRRRRLWT